MENITAVQWLKTEIEKHGDPEYLIIRWTDFDEFINQAKQMEKEQIVQAYHDDNFPCSHYGAEQYYNETFGKQ